MTNPVNPLGRSTAESINSNTRKTQPESRSDNSSSSSVSSEDTVSLSQESQQVSSLAQQLKEASVVDRAKVEAIKQEIANGNYPLDPEKIAENLINLEQSLLE